MDTRGPPSLSQSICNEMFAFVNVIADYVVTAKEELLRLGRMQSLICFMRDVVAIVRSFKVDMFSVQYCFELVTCQHPT